MVEQSGVLKDKSRWPNVGKAIRDHWILLAILSVAIIVRVWGIWNADSTDEYNEVFEALRVCSGQLNYERWFKRFYLYILSFEYCLFYLGGLAFGQFSSPMDFASKILQDLTPLFMLGRMTSAVMGTVSVFMTYQIGSLLYDKKVGLVASLFLCVNAVNIELSHYARVDATLCAVVLASFYFISKIAKNENASPAQWYALSGMLSGIAFQNKAPAIILWIPFWLAHLGRFNFRLSLQSLLGRGVVWFCCMYIIGMIIGNPAILFAPLKFVRGVLLVGEVFTNPINETKSENIGYIVYLLYFYRDLGLPLTMVAIFSLWRAFRESGREDILIISFILPFYGLMGASRYMVSDSYMIPLMPFLFLLCAKGIMALVVMLMRGHKPKTIMLICAVMILAVSPLAKASELLMSLTGKNTRYLAKEWIEQNIPFGSKILMDSGKTINSAAPPIKENRESILRTITELERKIENGTLADTTKIVDRNAVKYYQILLENAPEKSYDITSTKFGLEVQSIDFYIENGFKFFVISDNIKQNRSSAFFSQRSPDVSSFYNSLDSDTRLKLIKIIRPNSVSMGDSFYIYKVL
jgi:4-amino-4-deoxy-L-arabinose transferase-like glycosyltransferase